MTIDYGESPWDLTFQKLWKNADQAYTNNTTLTNITGLGFKLRANQRALFWYHLFYTSSATTIGIQLTMNGPASPTQLRYSMDVPWVTAVAGTGVVATAYGTVAAPTTGPGATAYFMRINGYVINGSTGGMVIPQYKIEAGTSGTVTILRGSHGWVDYFK
jgi:hypothetical protein